MAALYAGGGASRSREMSTPCTVRDTLQSLSPGNAGGGLHRTAALGAASGASRPRETSTPCAVLALQSLSSESALLFHAARLALGRALLRSRAGRRTRPLRPAPDPRIVGPPGLGHDLPGSAYTFDTSHASA